MVSETAWSDGDELTTDDLRRLIAALRSMAPAVDDADGIDRIRLFEELRAVAGAAQMREAVSVAASLEAANEGAGVPRSRRARGVASQIALARRISPHQASRWLGCARVLTNELPRTFAELEAGRTTPWRAVLVACETLFLSRAQRAVVDAEVAPKLERLGDQGVERAARGAACRLDPAAAADRARNAATERRVWIRPAPDLMCRVSALLPLTQGVAAYASLTSHAVGLIGEGKQGANLDGTLRGKGQVMADTFVERLTGQAEADAVPVEINLVMTDAELFRRDDLHPNDDGSAGDLIAAVVPGYGPVSTAYARELALGRGPRWIRRLFTAPRRSELAAMESRRREFTAAQRRFVRLRDHGTCRTPWCDAPIQHIDHVVPAEAGGRTAVGNAQGLCAACNDAKQAPGWRASPTRDGTVLTLTPTGHRYSSPRPEPPGRLSPHLTSPVERRFDAAVHAAA